MKIFEQTFPWKHWIVDNFIEKQDVAKLSHVAHKHIQEKNSKFHYTTDTLNEPYKNILETAINKMPAVIKELNYKSPRQHKKIHALGHLAINPAGYSFQPHCDDETKIWTFVTYIGPVKSIGTYVMSDMNNKDKIEIPWKPGRCLIFAGNNGETWHSYESGNNWRATITAYMNTNKNWGK